MSPLLRLPLRLPLFLPLLLAAPAAALPPAPETGPCSLEKAVPAAVAVVDDDLDLLLDDGRRAVLSGLEFPLAGDAPERAEAARRLAGRLVGGTVFLAALSGGVDRWGRAPVAAFAPEDDASESPLVNVGAALLDAGLARFRPDRPAADCSGAYLAAEALAREARRGLWARPENAPLAVVEAEAVNRNSEQFVNRKGMILVEGVVRSVKETRGAFYLNFGSRRANDFAVVILRRNLGMFERVELFPKALAGRRARVRGLIETGSGPRMEISSPAEIELLDGAR